MTLRSLEKFVQEQESEEQGYQEISGEVELLKTKLIFTNRAGDKSCKSFYKWLETQHEIQRQSSKNNCCFLDIIGRPQKDGKDMRLLPYQKLLWQMLYERRRLWIKKARGIGLSTLMLYIIAYKCLTEFQPGDRVVIITGIRIETAADLIRRFKLLFQRNFPNIYTELIKQKDTIAVLGGVIVEGYPAGHTDSVRGLDRVKMVWVDEGDWFAPAESKAVRSATEAFISKPNSENMYLVLSSTPNKPQGLFETIEKEDPSIYYKMFLPYQYGLEGQHPIYDLQQIERAKQSPDFGREFEGKYLGLIGNVISPIAIDRCIATGEVLAKTAPLDDWSIATNYVLSIDIGWGSSNTAIIMSRFVNGKVQIIYSKEFTRAVFSDIIEEIWRLYNKCNGKDNLQCIIIDAANTELYTALCQEFKQNPSLEYLREQQLHSKKVNRPLEEYLFVCPIAFGSQTHGGQQLLAHTRRIIEEQEESDGTALVGIAKTKQFEDLITSCRSAYAVEDKLDKERTVFADSFDALRMNLSYYKFDK